MLRKLNGIDDKFKDAAFGYIRRIEKKNKLFTTIPVMINYLCLNYYYAGEYFAKCAFLTRVSNNRMTITAHGYGTSYGNVWIDPRIPQIVRWTFKIGKDSTLTFGIVSSEDSPDPDYFYRWSVQWRTGDVMGA